MMYRRFILGSLGVGWLGAVGFGSQLAGVYRAGDGVPRPKILHKVEPRYTFEARRASIQGTVVLEVLVDENGQAEASTVISPLGFGLDDRAKEAVSQWTFSAGAERRQARQDSHYR